MSGRQKIGSDNIKKGREAEKNGPCPLNQKCNEGMGEVESAGVR